MLGREKFNFELMLCASGSATTSAVALFASSLVAYNMVTFVEPEQQPTAFADFNSLANTLANPDVMPTTELRKELDAAGFGVPDDSRLDALSMQFNQWLDALGGLSASERTVTFFTIFQVLDSDNSGFITYDELVHVVRKKLKVSQKQLTGNELKSLWCALDVDDSNRVDRDEFFAFFKRGAELAQAPTQLLDNKAAGAGKDFASQHSFAGMAAMNQVLKQKSTREMKKELIEAGVFLPDPAEQIALGKRFNDWLERYRREEGERGKASKAQSWYSLFKVVDDDGSGL